MQQIIKLKRGIFIILILGLCITACKRTNDNKPLNVVRIEPCEDPRCKTCSRARFRGLKKKRLAYTNNPDHYELTSPGKWELYDIESDPFQSNDIAAAHPEIVKK